MWKLLRRIAYWIRHRQHEKALAEEIEFHRVMKQEELERKGMLSADAVVHSRRALGNTLAAIENSREVWMWSWLDQFLRDARIGARSLLKSPGFTVFATLILSIGIGALVTVFTYFNAVFFKPLKIPNPAKYVRIYGTEGGDAPIGLVSYSTYLQYQERNRSLEQIGMFATSGTQFPLRVNGPRTLPLDIVQAKIVSNGLFKAIGAGMVLGRGIEPQDERAGAPNVVVLNEAAWERYFARDAKILNNAIYLNNTPYTVVGISPKSFQDALSLFAVPPSPQFFIAVRENVPPRRFVEVAGRLAAGVSLPQAQADLSRIAAQVAAEKQVRVGVSVERGDVPPSWLWVALSSLAALFLVLMFAVLLIVCDDIAIMLLARIAARQREMGIRVALGGSRLQLIRQLVSENILISVLGGAGALIFMLMISRLIERLPITTPNTPRVVFDWRVLAFTIVVSLATTLFFGLRPALECVSRDVVASLSPGAKAPGRRQGKVRSNLVLAQITICTTLLIITLVVIRSVNSIVFVDRGYKTDHLLLADINFTGTSYTRDLQLAFYRQLLPRLTGAQGILSVSVSNDSEGLDTVQTGAGNVSLPVRTMAIDEGYFPTLQVPLIAGRSFNEQDKPNSAPVGIINQKMALLFPRTVNPIGQRMRTGDGTQVEIVGIATNINYGMNKSATPVLYRPVSQAPWAPSNTIMMKFSGAASAAERIIREKVTEADPSLLVYNVTTLDDRQERRLLPYHIVGYVIGIPGAFVLLLGIIGTYGTMAILVAQRRREVGIRIALGAHPSTAVRMILGEGIKSISMGMALGTAAAVVIVLWLNRQVTGVPSFDPVAFVSMILLVMATSGTACYIPSRRASRVDPMIVLRED